MTLIFNQSKHTTGPRGGILHIARFSCAPAPASREKRINLIRIQFKKRNTHNLAQPMCTSTYASIQCSSVPETYTYYIRFAPHN